MTGVRIRGLIAAIGACAVLAGCGGDDNGKQVTTRSGGGRTQGSNSTTPTKAGSQILANPVNPTCVPQGFKSAGASPLVGKGVKAWRLQFTRTDTSPPKLGTPTLVLVVEQVASGPLPKPAGARETEVAGRKVNLTPQRRGTYLARWRTPRAAYTAISDGKNVEVLKRFIPCFP